MTSKEDRIVVIGAGMAGLSAAQYLVKNGFKHVTIVEASGRIGGRIYTEEFGDGFVNPGANFIHDISKDNSVYNFAKERGLIKKPYLSMDRESIPWYSINGKEVKMTTLIKAANFFEKFHEELKKGIPAEGSITYLEFMRKRIQEVIGEISESKRSRVTDVLNSLIDVTALGAGNDADVLSPLFFLDADNLPEGKDYVVPGGFYKVIESLASDLPDESVRLNNKVVKIDWSDKKKVLITCKRTDDEYVLDADHVIITCSLGHLKQFYKVLFTPELPQWKSNAIEAVGFGQVEGIYSYYEKPFWKPKKATRFVVWEKDTDTDLPSWFRPPFIYEAPTSANKIGFWLYGREASKVCALSKEEVNKLCTSFFRKVFANDSIPEPTDIKVSTWSTDPLFGGAYSNLTIHSNGTCRGDLAKPILLEDKPVLCFAGEATDEKSSATAHGARDSGIREAERICKFLS